MECSEPGTIRDEELLAYLAGEIVRPDRSAASSPMPELFCKISGLSSS